MTRLSVEKSLWQSRTGLAKKTFQIHVLFDKIFLRLIDELKIRPVPLTTSLKVFFAFHKKVVEGEKWQRIIFYHFSFAFLNNFSFLV